MHKAWGYITAGALKIGRGGKSQKSFWGRAPTTKKGEVFFLGGKKKERAVFKKNPQNISSGAEGWQRTIFSINLTIKKRGGAFYIEGRIPPS